eukprot:COSAG01_NODE_3087_length_6609_cov_2.598925_7_plen_186_part_00
MVYSDQDGFPYDDWVAWEYVSYLWGHGEEPDEAGGECTTLYYEGCDDEVDLEQLAALVEDGTIVDETLVYSDQAAFPFEGWTAWEECSYLFGVGEAPEGGCTTLVYEVCLPPSRRPPAPSQSVEAGGRGDESSGHRIEAPCWPCTSECPRCGYPRRLNTIGVCGRPRRSTTKPRMRWRPRHSWSC